LFQRETKQSGGFSSILRHSVTPDELDALYQQSVDIMLKYPYIIFRAMMQPANPFGPSRPVETLHAPWGSNLRA
jgi:hypothetical protein